jgi:hypothetical protein
VRQLAIEPINPKDTFTITSIIANNIYDSTRFILLFLNFFEGLVLSSTISAYRYDFTTETSRLLGVSGTDIPVDIISRFIKPHQLGPNGYAFLLTKNGYAVIHSGLKLYHNDKLRKNYRSMNLTKLDFLVNK